MKLRFKHKYEKVEHAEDEKKDNKKMRHFRLLKNIVCSFLVCALLLFVFIFMGDIEPLRTGTRKDTQDIKHIIYPNIQNVSELEQCSEEIFIYLQFVMLDGVNEKLVSDFFNLILSILLNTRCRLYIFVAADENGKMYAEAILENFSSRYTWLVTPEVKFYHIHDIGRKLVKITKPMKELFTTAQASYYSKTLFRTTPGIFQILPTYIKEILVLDLDMVFLTDIHKLWKLFKNMRDGEIMALAHEQQPVYYHLTTKYRETNPGNNIGKPLPHGNPGVNGGVKLFKLSDMRKSTIYNSYLNSPVKLRKLADKYHFRGHLGDQDFYTLIGFEHPELISILPCGWNRQHCQWWKDHGYIDIFDMYSNCSTPYHVLHGNCNSNIPSQYTYKCFR